MGAGGVMDITPEIQARIDRHDRIRVLRERAKAQLDKPVIPAELRRALRTLRDEIVLEIVRDAIHGNDAGEYQLAVLEALIKSKGE